MNIAINKNNILALILDMDGVLWRGPEPLGDLPAIFGKIRNRGWRFVLATNNSTRTPQQYIEKLAEFGVQVEETQVINSSEVTAEYLQRRFPERGPLYIVGEIGLFTALEKRGFYHDETHAQAVVAGMDRGLTFESLSKAASHIRSGLPFIATNPDNTFPTPDGLIPGTGAMIAAIAAASGVEPVVIGKPNPDMYRAAIDRLKTSPEQTLVVGDRLETDIVGAQALGCRTAVVLTGVTTRQKAEEWSPAPHYIADSLTALLEKL